MFLLCVIVQLAALHYVRSTREKEQLLGGRNKNNFDLPMGLWFGCDMSPVGLCVWTLCPHIVLLLEKVSESLEGEALLVEVNHWILLSGPNFLFILCLLPLDVI